MNHAKEKAARRAERERQQRLLVSEHHAREAKLQERLRSRTTGFDAERLHKQVKDTGQVEFLKVVFEKAPKLATVEPEALKPFKHIYVCPNVRSVADWEPEGKGRRSLFESLVDHMLSRYPVPRFLYNVFEARTGSTNDDDLLLFCHLAQGGSVAAAVKLGLIRVPLTKRMAHLFTQAPEDLGVVGAVRWAQVRAFGGSDRLARAVMATHLRDYQLDSAREEFWATVLQWLSLNPMLATDQVGPIFDYLSFRRNADPTFSMKGRSVLAVLRETEEWHKQLQRAKATQQYVFKPSGFHGFRLEEGSGKVWQIREIMSAKELRAEGSELRHCVWSYARYIADGRTSIWSMTVTERFMESRCLTLEVDNKRGAIVQARGYCNRFATQQENNILQQWCSSQSDLSYSG